MASKTKSRLGRGLSALMAQPVKVSPEPEQPKAEVVTQAVKEAHGQAAAKTEAKVEAKVEAKAAPAAPNTKAAVVEKETPAKAGKSDVSQKDAKSSASNKTSNTDKTSKAAGDNAKTERAETAESSNVADTAGQTSNEQVEAGGISWLSPKDICPNPHQPRRMFNEGALATLSASIKSSGLMQPIIVRPGKAGAKQPYELVAGERRWRAVQLAGLETIPAIVRDLDENQSAEWALVENLQREDLNPMERAEAFAHLISQFNLSHEQIAQRVGVERSTISNLLRFIDLETQVKDWVRQGRLSAGQARALAGVTDKTQQQALAKKVIAQEMSVRAVEAAVRQLNQNEQSSNNGEPLKTQARAAHLADLEQQISQQLETKVRIRPGRKKGSGTMSIDFYSVDQFDTLLKRLAVDAE